MSRNAYPLSWPEGWKRTLQRTRATFGKAGAIMGNARTSLSRLSVSDAVQRLLGELQRMGIRQDDVLISTNVELRLDGLPRSDREPRDPGAAVYWNIKGKTRVMAIDKYDRVADNLAAIAATLEAMRAIERHGGAVILDRAFTGFAALPEHASENWRTVLGIPASMEKPALGLIEERFRALVMLHHPDRGGDRATFEQIVAAREAARQESQLAFQKALVRAPASRQRSCMNLFTVDDIARDLCAQTEYKLRCNQCGLEVVIAEADFAAYLRSGWPKCCSYTMTLEKAQG